MRIAPLPTPGKPYSTHQAGVNGIWIPDVKRHVGVEDAGTRDVDANRAGLAERDVMLQREIMRLKQHGQRHSRIAAWPRERDE
jgi:hypothetical protein